MVVPKEKGKHSVTVIISAVIVPVPPVPVIVTFAPVSVVVPFPTVIPIIAVSFVPPGRIVSGIPAVVWTWVVWTISIISTYNAVSNGLEKRGSNIRLSPRLGGP